MWFTYYPGVNFLKDCSNLIWRRFIISIPSCIHKSLLISDPPWDVAKCSSAGLLCRRAAPSSLACSSCWPPAKIRSKWQLELCPLRGVIPPRILAPACQVAGNSFTGRHWRSALRSLASAIHVRKPWSWVPRPWVRSEGISQRPSADVHRELH